ncbi:putative methyltransferase PMT15 [Zea mays]|uniref:Methyltransferase n=1 Tax=Zea mays TaxID=4577 RepID=A0A1D6E2G0_MAIZE|nr:putative methyltransferase PMT15 [Zea mays]
MAVGATATKLLPSAAAAARRPSMLHLAAVAVLCSLSYLLGIWHHGGFSAGPAAGDSSSSVSIATAVSCATPAPTTASSSPPAGPLDFAAHHTAEGVEAEGALRHRNYEACPAKYSEYTPCEDVERSLRFPRDRLVYRERHCPAAGERLRCLVPAPKGYRNPFPYDKMEACITPLPEVSDLKEVAGGSLKKWPERLTAVPPRIASGSIEGVTEEMFVEDTELWKKRVGHYKSVIAQLGQKGRYRNLLDMNAKFGGFAAALVNDPLWVMNMVPTVGNSTTLGVIYERGLIGSYQDWCEGMSTYPRTYDLIHADTVFTLYNGRCEAENILLEMDRILRPEGTVIIRDDVDLLVKIKSMADGMRWNSQIVDHEDGPLVREKLLLVVKTYWTLDGSEQ